MSGHSIRINSGGNYLDTYRDRERKSRLRAVLDYALVRATFGVALPVMFALLLWDFPLRLNHSARHIRFDPVGHEELGLVAALACLYLAWSFLGVRSRGFARAMAPALACGTAVAAAYALLFLRLFAGGLAGAGPADGDDVLLALFGVAFVAIPLVTTALFCSAARDAFAASGTRAAAHPWRATAVAVGALAIAGLALAVTYHASRALALHRLREDREDSVASALLPLRIAILVGGEDRLVRAWAFADGVDADTFEAAFLQVTGHSALERWDTIAD